MSPNLDAAPGGGEPGTENLASTKKTAPRVALLVGTVFGLGYLPLAPGTWGSLAGVALAYLFLRKQVPPEVVLHQTYYVIAFPNLWLVFVSAISLVGIWAASQAAGYLSTRDPQIVVIDEVAGQMLALLLGPAMFARSTNWEFYLLGGAMFTGVANWKYFLLGFILFRVFDIWKPFPVNRAESLPGGLGIMADDWVAGLYAAACLWLARAIGV